MRSVQLPVNVSCLSPFTFAFEINKCSIIWLESRIWHNRVCWRIRIQANCFSLAIPSVPGHFPPSHPLPVAANLFKTNNVPLINHWKSQSFRHQLPHHWQSIQDTPLSCISAPATITLLISTSQPSPCSAVSQISNSRHICFARALQVTSQSLTFWQGTFLCMVGYAHIGISRRDVRSRLLALCFANAPADMCDWNAGICIDMNRHVLQIVYVMHVCTCERQYCTGPALSIA